MADTLHGGGEGKGELRSCEEITGPIRGLQEIDDGDDIGEADV